MTSILYAICCRKAASFTQTTLVIDSLFAFPSYFLLYALFFFSLRFGNGLSLGRITAAFISDEHTTHIWAKDLLVAVDGGEEGGDGDG